MKSYLVLFSFVAAISAEEKPASAVTQERINSDAQEYDEVPAYYKFSQQRSAQIPEHLLNYSPQAAANYVPQFRLVSQQPKYAATPVPAHIMYGFAPQVQQQLNYAAQPAQKSQPAPAVKQLPAQAIPFSPASEVSSFRFSSPLVTYSNQGVLQQLTGKLATEGVQVSQESQTAAPKKITAPQQLSPHSQSPQFAQEALAQEYTYSSRPQGQIQFVPQRVAYASQQPEAKATYVSLPKQYYAVAAPQQVAYSPQQIAYAPSDAQQYSYVLAVPQGSRAAAQQAYLGQQQPTKYTSQAENYQN